MLVLERKQGQSIIIGDFLEVVIIEITEENEIHFGIRTTEEPHKIPGNEPKPKDGNHG